MSEIKSTLDLVMEKTKPLSMSAEEKKISDRRLVVGGVLSRIDPSQDNKRWMDLLAALAPEVSPPLRETLATYREQETGLSRSVERRLLDRLKKIHGIEGSAVVCNPEKDASYLENLAALREETRSQIAKVSQKAV